MTEPKPPEGGRRRAENQPATGWFPWGQRRPKKFLPGLPDHSETGVIHREAIERARRGEIPPDQVPRRRKRLVSRTFFAFLVRWRYFVSTSTALLLTMSLIAGALVLFRDSFNDPNKLPTYSAPTLDELNNSIELAQRYLGSLYKPLEGGQAVQSEASGVPLRAHFLDTDRWVLLGEDVRCEKQDCKTTTSLTDVHDSATSDDYKVAFHTPAAIDALKVHVQINWTFSPTQFQITTTPLSVKEKVELWLDTVKLSTFEPGSTKSSARALGNDSQSQLRMLRFTIRHATQEAYLYYSTYGKNPERAAALKKFLEANGYVAGYDLRAALFDANGKLPDDLPVNDKAYPDCDHTAASSPLAYAYRSKVCLFITPYLISGDRDPFLQAWDALTVLMKYDDPNHEQPEWGWWTQGDTPVEVSQHLRGQWNRSGSGVPKCTPFSCAEESDIRTAAFGALETQLGYVHGDEKSKKFADAAAKVVTMVQIGTDGKFKADNGITYTRPGQAGSFLSAWTPKLEFTQPSTPKLPVAVALTVRGAIPTPLEYQGIIPSNSETSFDALGFLLMYRCAKYHVGCLPA